MICTPTQTHPELVYKCLNAGYPVFCEKPVALSLSDMYRLAKEKNLSLLCGFHRRFDPTFVKLKAAVESGAVGAISVIRTTSRDGFSAQFLITGGYGGLFQDCATHDIDAHRWLMGTEPVEVFSYANAVKPEVRKSNDCDVLGLIMRWPSGSISMVDISRVSSYGYDQRIEVLGSEGMAEAQNRPKTTLVVSNDNGCADDMLSQSFMDRYEAAYLAEACHFVEILDNRHIAPKVSRQDARNTFLICAAAEESARTGRAVKINYK